MGTEFKVEKDSYMGDIVADPKIIDPIEAAILAKVGKSRTMVFALVVAVDPKAKEAKTYEGEIFLLCGKCSDTDATNTYLSAIPNNWHKKEPPHTDPDRKKQGPFLGTAYVLPSVHDILVVTYPGEEYIGYCTYVGGYPRWY